MHRAQNYINGQVVSAVSAPRFASGYVVTPSDVAALRSCLDEDALGYAYSSCVSLVDALHGIRAGFLSWSTVKLYYSAFYSFRAMLALDGVCVYYQKHTPYSVMVVPGAVCQKESGVTHKLIIKLFKESNKRHFLLSQPIDMVDAPDWLVDRREEANYKNGKFYDPSPPVYFEKIVDMGVRKAIDAYAADTVALYCFDSDHAVLAYPLAVLSEMCRMLRARVAVRLAVGDTDFLRRSAKDQSGGLPALHRIFALLG